MSLLKSLSKSAARAMRDLKHQRDGLFYDTQVPTTPHKLALLMLTPEVQLTLLYRYYSALHDAGYWRTATVFYLYAKKAYGCDIAPGARIGGGLRITHSSNIVVGAEVEIGEDVALFNGATLGNRLSNSGSGMPHVGNRVLIATGAKILGALEIGDEAVIGANAVVLEPVPEGCVAVGIPARLIHTGPLNSSKKTDDQRKGNRINR